MAETKSPAKAPRTATLKRRNKWTRDDTELTILALPTSIWFLLFCYLPMFGIIIAFKDYKIAGGAGFLSSLLSSEWVGFDNFMYFFTLSDFPQILRNTVLYNLLFIVLDIVLPVGLAIMISNIYSKAKSKVYQTLMFMPHFMSWVVVSYFVYAFLITDKGLLNQLLVAIGGEDARINWYFEPDYWPWILTIMHIWKGIGYSMVVYLASITGIDTSLYEAAVLDGASKWQQAKYITLPSLQPMIILMFIMAVGRMFSSDFGLFYQVSRGANMPLTPVVATFDVKIYQMLTSVPIGKTSAASMFQSVIGCIMILSANAVVRKVDPDSAMI